MSEFADYVDEAGITRLRATGGGAAAGTQGGVYLLTAEAVAPDTTTPFTWSFEDGAALLDLAAPTAPLPLVAGVYALTMQLFVPDSLGGGKAVFSTFAVDSDNLDPSIQFGGVPVSFAGSTSFATNGAAITFYSPADSAMQANVAHDDVAARDCFANAYVQRVA